MIFIKPENVIINYFKSQIRKESNLIDGLAIICNNYNKKYKQYNRTNDEDMLLFQFGQYNWGEGENIEFDFIRQLIKNEVILQIHITYKFDSTNTEKIEKGFTKWLDQEKELENWKNEIMENEIFKKFNQIKPIDSKIWMEDAE